MLPMADDAQVSHAPQADMVGASLQPSLELPVSAVRPTVYKADMTRRRSRDASHMVPAAATACSPVAELPCTCSSRCRGDDQAVQPATALRQTHAEARQLPPLHAEPAMRALRRFSSGLSSVAQLGEDESVASEHDGRMGGSGDSSNGDDAVRATQHANATHCTTATTSCNVTAIAATTTTATSASDEVVVGRMDAVLPDDHTVASTTTAVAYGAFAGTPPHTPVDHVIPAIQGSYALHGNISTTTAPARTAYTANECDVSGTSHRTRPGYALSFQRSLLTPHKSTMAPTRHHSRPRALNFASRVQHLSVRTRKKSRAASTAATTVLSPTQGGLPCHRVATPLTSGLAPAAPAADVAGVHDGQVCALLRRERGPSAARPGADSPAGCADNDHVPCAAQSQRARPDLVDRLEPSRNPYSPYRYPVALQTMTLFTPLVLARGVAHDHTLLAHARTGHVTASSLLRAMPLRAEAAVVMYAQTIPTDAMRRDASWSRAPAAHTDPSQSVAQATVPPRAGHVDDARHTHLTQEDDEDQAAAATAMLRLDSSDERPLEALDGVPLVGLSSLSDILHAQDNSLQDDKDSSVHGVLGGQETRSSDAVMQCSLLRQQPYQQCCRMTQTQSATTMSPCHTPRDDLQTTQPRWPGHAAATELVCASHELRTQQTGSPARPASRGCCCCCCHGTLAGQDRGDDEEAMGQANTDSPPVRRVTVQWCAKNDASDDFLIAVAEPPSTCAGQAPRAAAANEKRHAVSCRVVRRLGYSESDAESDGGVAAGAATPVTSSVEPRRPTHRAHRAASAPSISANVARYTLSTRPQLAAKATGDLPLRVQHDGTASAVAPFVSSVVPARLAVNTTQDATRQADSCHARPFVAAIDTTVTTVDAALREECVCDMQHRNSAQEHNACVAAAHVASQHISTFAARMNGSSVTAYDALDATDETSEYSGTTDDGSSCNDDDEEDEPGDRFRQHHRFQFLQHVPFVDPQPFFLPLASDANGVVWLATHRLDGMPYAVKEVRLPHTCVDHMSGATPPLQRPRQQQLQLCAELECTSLNHAAPTTTLRQSAARFLVSYAVPVRYPAALPRHERRESGNHGLTMEHKGYGEAGNNDAAAAAAETIAAMANGATAEGAIAAGQQVLLLQSEYFPRGSVWEWALDPFAKRCALADMCSADLPGACTATTAGVAAAAAALRTTTTRPAYDLPPEAFWCDVLQQALCALQTLHAHELVHGCPLPLHLWVSAAGVFKLGDFGAARKRPQRYPDAAPRFLRGSSHRRTRSDSARREKDKAGGYDGGDEDEGHTPYTMDVRVLCNGVLLLLMLCCVKASMEGAQSQHKPCPPAAPHADGTSHTPLPTMSCQRAQESVALPSSPCGGDEANMWQARWYSAELLDAFLCHGLAGNAACSAGTATGRRHARHDNAEGGGDSSDESIVTQHGNMSREQRQVLLHAAGVRAHKLHGFLRVLLTLRTQPHTAATALQAFSALSAAASPALLAARALYDAELTRLLCHRAILRARLQMTRASHRPQPPADHARVAPADVKAVVPEQRLGRTAMASSRGTSEQSSAECRSSSVASEEVTGGQTGAVASLLGQPAPPPPQQQQQHATLRRDKSAQSYAGSTQQPHSTVPWCSSSEAHTTSTTSPPLLPPPLLITPCRSLPPSPCLTAALRHGPPPGGGRTSHSIGSGKLPSPALLPHAWSITSEPQPHALSRRAPPPLPPSLALAPPLSFAGASTLHGWPATHHRSASDVQPLRSTHAWGATSAAATRRASMSRVSWPAAMPALLQTQHAAAAAGQKDMRSAARLLGMMHETQAVHGAQDMTHETGTGVTTAATQSRRMASHGSYASRLEGVVRPQVQATVESMVLGAIGLSPEARSCLPQPQAAQMLARQLTWHYRQCVQLMHCDTPSACTTMGMSATRTPDAGSGDEATWCHVRDCPALRSLRPLTSWE